MSDAITITIESTENEGTQDTTTTELNKKKDEIDKTNFLVSSKSILMSIASNVGYHF